MADGKEGSCEGRKVLAKYGGAFKTIDTNTHNAEAPSTRVGETHTSKKLTEKQPEGSHRAKYGNKQSK